MRTRAAALLLLLCGAAAAATGLAGAAGQQTAAEDATMPADSAWLDGSSRKLLQAVKDCTRTHKACSQCRNQRIPGTRKTEQVCSACITGWRVRQNGPNKSKVCGEQAAATLLGPRPALAANEQCSRSMAVQ